jgi:hypothetical protein
MVVDSINLDGYKISITPTQWSKLRKMEMYEPKLTNKSDAAWYFERFENYALLMRWAVSTWVMRIEHALDGKARDAMYDLPTKYFDYITLKTAVLKVFKRNKNQSQYKGINREVYIELKATEELLREVEKLEIEDECSVRKRRAEIGREEKRIEMEREDRIRWEEIERRKLEEKRLQLEREVKENDERHLESNQKSQATQSKPSMTTTAVNTEINVVSSATKAINTEIVLKATKATQADITVPQSNKVTMVTKAVNTVPKPLKLAKTVQTQTVSKPVKAVRAFTRQHRVAHQQPGSPSQNAMRQKLVTGNFAIEIHTKGYSF